MKAAYSDLTQGESSFVRISVRPGRPRESSHGPPVVARGDAYCTALSVMALVQAPSGFLVMIFWSMSAFSVRS